MEAGSSGGDGDAFDGVEVEAEVVSGVVGEDLVVLGEGGDDVAVDVADGVDLAIEDDGADSDGIELDPLGSNSSRGRKKSSKEEMGERLAAAVRDYKGDMFRSVRACATYHRVSHVSLGRMLKDPDRQYQGKGKVSTVFTREEEVKFAAHIKERMLLGCGMDVMMVQFLMRDCIVAIKAADPSRTTPYDTLDPEQTHLQYLPNDQFVRTFLRRHNIVQRRSMPLNHSRAILTVDDLQEWQNLTENALFSDPVTAEIMRGDGSRIFNQDETSLCPGVDHQRVLTPKGWDGPVYNTGGATRLHVTQSVIVSADGKYASSRLVFKGSRGRHKQCKDIPSTGIAGKWKHSVAPKGYVTREVFLEILGDLVEHIKEKNIVLPVILFIDGYAGHLGPEISDYCKENQIILRLFR